MSIAPAVVSRHRRTGLAATLALALLAVAAPPAAADPLEDAYRAGVALAERGRLEQAAPYFEEALRLAREKFGKGAPETAVEVSNLAEVYRRLGRLEEAEPLAREAVELDRKAGRGEEADAAASLNNLALILVAKGRFDEAEELHRQSLRILQDKLGPTHPDVARSLHNLAVAYAERGEPQRALALERRAHAIAVNALGPGHPVSQRIERSMAALGDPMPAVGATAAEAAPLEPAAGRAAPGAPLPVSRPERPGDADAVQTALEAAMAERPAVPEPAAGPAPVAAAAPVAGIAEAPPPDGSWYVLLASIGDPELLPREWRRLQRRHAVLREATALRSLPASGSRRLWRLMTGPYDARADADRVCQAVLANRGRCEVIRR